jgi:hypothetical protein
VSDQDLPPAGWYPDPDVPGGERYWDGAAWAEDRRSAGPPPSPWGTAPAATPSTAPDSPAPGGLTPQGGTPSWETATGPAAQGAGEPIDTWLWQSIVATILCCQPLGIVAIVMSAQAGSARDAGNWELARKRAGQARTWTLAAVGAFFVLFLPFVLVLLFA